MNVRGKDIKIFAASSSINFASEMAHYLGLPLGKSEISRFSDGETKISLFETVRGSDVFVVQSTCHPVNDNIMELLLMIDAFKRASAGRITAVIPYFGYARQDRKAKSRDPISAKLVADLLTTAGADRILTMDLHAPQIQGFFNIPVDDLVGMPVLVPYFKKKYDGRLDNTVVVSPDFGSINRARSFATKLNVSMAIIDKRRPEANVSEVMNLIGEVKDKDVVIYDDMIDTAGSICNAVDAVIERGAKSVSVGITHAVLSGPALERLSESPVEEIAILDTIELPEEKRIDKINVLSVSHIFAEAVSRIFSDKPMTTLYEGFDDELDY
ncbi:MAG: ribose-phosphate pyrophosphokinase [Ruminococcaceae bacterium]|nr:ribose-phosphate pyrophosphokinase [Oscillospiraceae bacterium]